MLGYQSIGTNDLDKAVAFWDGLLALLGGKRAMQTAKGHIYAFAGGGAMFMITRPYDDQPATIGNGQMTAFRATSESQVKDVYDKAIELGGSCEGEPGPRGDFGYFAYFRDPDGNKHAVFFIPG